MKNQGYQIYGKAGKGIKLEEGMTLAIEPMVNLRGTRSRSIRKWVDSSNKRWKFISPL